MNKKQGPNDPVTTASYLENEVLGKYRKWALCAWQHCPALLQHTTTNASECYHRWLKAFKGSKKARKAAMKGLG